MAKPKKTAAEFTLKCGAKLWPMANALRNSMDEAEHKHVFLGHCARRSPSNSIVAMRRSLRRLPESKLITNG